MLLSILWPPLPLSLHELMNRSLWEFNICRNLKHFAKCLCFLNICVEMEGFHKAQALYSKIGK